MKRCLVSISFLFLFVFYSSASYALSVDADVGFFFPPAGSAHSPSFYYGASLSQGIYDYIALQANYYHYESYTSSGANSANNYSLVGNAVEFLLKATPVKYTVEPYVAVGGGYYTNSEGYKVGADPFTREYLNGFGFVAEVGFNIFIFDFLQFGLNGKYNYFALPDSKYYSEGNMKGSAGSVGVTLTFIIPSTEPFETKESYDLWRGL